MHGSGTGGAGKAGNDGWRGKIDAIAGAEQDLGIGLQPGGNDGGVGDAGLNKHFAIRSIAAAKDGFDFAAAQLIANAQQDSRRVIFPDREPDHVVERSEQQSAIGWVVIDDTQRAPTERKSFRGIVARIASQKASAVGQTQADQDIAVRSYKEALGGRRVR